jgi:hypothetical protein
MPDPQPQAPRQPKVECTGRSYRWVAVSGRREQKPSFFTVIVWRDQAEHAAEPWWSAGGNVGDGFPAWAKVIVTWTPFTQTNS